MLTPRRLVLSNPRVKKLLWAAVKGNGNIVIDGGIASRRTTSVRSLRQLMRGPRQRVIVLMPETRMGAQVKRWHP